MLHLLGYFQAFQLTWSYLLSQLVAGIALGGIYGLIALGYSMVYGILKLLNFAHGEVFMIGSFIGYFVLTALGGSANPSLPVGIVIVLMFGAAMVGSGLLGVAVERFAYRPLREKKAPRIAPLISALGVSFCLQQIAVICFGATPHQYNSFVLSGGALFKRITIGAFQIQYIQLMVILLAGFLMVLLTQFVTPHPDRPRHARHLLRPRGGVDDGDRRRPRHRRHVPDRLCARGGRRRHERA